MQIGVISPQDWGLPTAPLADDVRVDALNLTAGDIQQRIRACTYTWAQRHFNAEAGAFFGFYSASDQRFEPPQTVNLIAPWQFIAAYDFYGDAQLLRQAEQAADWFYRHFVITHPMSVVIGGVRESLPEGELWTKFAAEFVLLSLGLHQRTGAASHLDRARQSLMFLIQATRYDFGIRYNTRAGRWFHTGWQSFGRVIEAFLLMAATTGETTYQQTAIRWGEYGLTLQADDGGFYLIDDDYFNTDIAADELRGLVFLHEQTGRADFLDAARRFAGWLIAQQREDGAWPLTIDRDGNIVVPTAGPGDIPNIAIALLRLHHVTGDETYLDAALRCLRYTLTTQVLPGSDHPYSDDPNAQWGFWSWDPYYDYTLSGDQATHHIRGLLFILAYLRQLGRLPGA